MKNFVKVELGCRGEVENIELVKTSYELIEDEYDDKIVAMIESDFEYIDFLEEFANFNIDKEKGEVRYGFSEDDCTFYVEYDKNVELCEGLLKCWEDDDLDVEFWELIGSLGC